MRDHPPLGEVSDAKLARLMLHNGLHAGRRFIKGDLKAFKKLKDDYKRWDFEDRSRDEVENRCVFCVSRFRCLDVLNTAQ